MQNVRESNVVTSTSRFELNIWIYFIRWADLTFDLQTNFDSFSLLLAVKDQKTTKSAFNENLWTIIRVQ